MAPSPLPRIPSVYELHGSGGLETDRGLHAKRQVAEAGAPVAQPPAVVAAAWEIAVESIVLCRVETVCLAMILSIYLSICLSVCLSTIHLPTRGEADHTQTGPQTTARPAARLRRGCDYEGHAGCTRDWRPRVNWWGLRGCERSTLCISSSSQRPSVTTLDPPSAPCCRRML